MHDAIIVMRSVPYRAANLVCKQALSRATIQNAITENSVLRTSPPNRASCTAGAQRSEHLHHDPRTTGRTGRFDNDTVCGCGGDLDNDYRTPPLRVRAIV